MWWRRLWRWRRLPRRRRGRLPWRRRWRLPRRWRGRLPRRWWGRLPWRRRSWRRPQIINLQDQMRHERLAANAASRFCFEANAILIEMGGVQTIYEEDVRFERHAFACHELSPKNLWRTVQCVNPAAEWERINDCRRSVIGRLS